MRKSRWMALALPALALTVSGCAVFRPLLFWRDTLIVGRIQLADEKGAPLASVKPAGITVNFINVTGKIEESVLSSQTDETGRYRSPIVQPGKYKVEAMLSGFAIETFTLEVANHEHGDADFTLKKIREAKMKAIKESKDENIPTPGDVHITPPF